MSYTKQSWVAPTGTGLNRYAKGTETETHIALTLDPESLTNTPTPYTVARMAHIEDGIAEAHAIENVYPIEWQEYALGQTSRDWGGVTSNGIDVYACVRYGDIYKQTGGTGDFVALGQTSRAWYGMASNGIDVYASDYNGDIYKQTGGTGDFVALGQTSRNWTGMASNGIDVYACVNNGDIYKQTGGTGDFVALGQTSRYWTDMASNGIDVYACVNNGDIYKQTGGTGDFVALGQTSRAWYGMASNGIDVYACVYDGDIYKQTGGIGDFVALGQTTRNWYGMTTLGNDIYACVYAGDIYKHSLSNTIRASANFTLGTYADGSRKRIANTHATNTITVTLPTGQKMNGQSSFTIAPDTLLEFELIGTAWKCVSNKWELLWTNPGTSLANGNYTLSGTIVQFKYYFVSFGLFASNLLMGSHIAPTTNPTMRLSLCDSRNYHRTCSLSGTTFSAGQGFTVTSYATAESVDNGVIVPLYVYGMK